MVGFTVLKSSKCIKAIKQPKSVPPSIPSPFLRTTFPSFPLSIPSFQLIYVLQFLSFSLITVFFLHTRHTHKTLFVSSVFLLYSHPLLLFLSLFLLISGISSFKRQQAAAMESYEKRQHSNLAEKIKPEN